MAAERGGLVTSKTLTSAVSRPPAATAQAEEAEPAEPTGMATSKVSAGGARRGFAGRGSPRHGSPNVVVDGRPKPPTSGQGAPKFIAKAMPFGWKAPPNVGAAPKLGSGPLGQPAPKVLATPKQVSGLLGQAEPKVQAKVADLSTSSARAPAAPTRAPMPMPAAPVSGTADTTTRAPKRKTKRRQSCPPGKQPKAPQPKAPQPMTPQAARAMDCEVDEEDDFFEYANLGPRTRKALRQFPSYQGEMPPEDAEDLWTEQDMHNFFFSSGFIRPKTRTRPKLSKAALEEHFRALGVLSGTKLDEVRRAYRKLALKLHPDKNQDNQDATEFQKIATAYEAVCFHLQSKG